MAKGPKRLRAVLGAGFCLTLLVGFSGSPAGATQVPANTCSLVAVGRTTTLAPSANGCLQRGPFGANHYLFFYPTVADTRRDAKYALVQWATYQLSGGTWRLTGPQGTCLNGRGVGTAEQCSGQVVPRANNATTVAIRQRVCTRSVSPPNTGRCTAWQNGLVFFWSHGPA